MLAAAGCSSSPAPQAPTAEPERQIPREERPFLVDPFLGYPATPEPGRADRIRAAHRALQAGEVSGPAAEVAAVLAEDPAFHPARVLAAELDLIEGDSAAAATRLRPLVEEVPQYGAALWVLARAEERLDRIPAAYRSFRRTLEVARRAAEGGASPWPEEILGLAREREAALRQPALAIVGRRFDDALEREQLDRAGEQLELLGRWAPDAPASRWAEARLARVRGDLKGELAALAELQRLDPEGFDLERQVRQAELELEVGDPNQGLQTLQALAEERPDDPRLAEALESAKFRWRLTLLPGHVAPLGRKAELSRADLAVLLYWLVPEVRYGRPSAGRIAGDILDHPRREEISRVVNLRLMGVDSTLHAFSPGAPARRGTALEALLRLLAASGQPIACLEGTGLGASSNPSTSTVCRLAPRCGLVDAEADCLPNLPLSGTEALEMIRRHLRLVGR